MLAIADRDGVIEGSVPGLASEAKITLEETLRALEAFKSPDPWSRTKDNEGRRIEEIPGGWRLLNYDLYREKLSQSDQRINAAERQARARRRRVSVTPNENITQSGDQSRINVENHANVTLVTPSHEKSHESQEITLAEAEAEAEAEADKKQREKPNTREIDYATLSELYPREVNQMGMQMLISLVRSPEDEQKFRTVIAARKQTDAWRTGMVKGFENYMKCGDWCIMPKEPVAESGKKLDKIKDWSEGLE